MSRRDALLATVEACTGLLARPQGEHVATVGRLIQAAIKKEMLDQLSNEWSQLRDEGKIPDEFAESEACQDAFSRVGRAVDSEYVERESLQMIRKIFLAAAMRNDQDGMASHYIEIARLLEIGEVQLLQACYRKSKDPGCTPRKGDVGFQEWAEKIAVESGLKYLGLVEKHAESLAEKKLLEPRRHRDLSGFREHPHFGLTDLSFNMMEYVSSLDLNESQAAVQ